MNIEATKSAGLVGRQSEMSRVRMGFDLVDIRKVRSSLAEFGMSFRNKLFTPGELAYAGLATEQACERLAARFAAKEAVIKALQLSDAGISWREIEVVKLPGGDCEITLHGRVSELAQRMGLSRLALSMSHDGDYAGAVVTAIFGVNHPPHADLFNFDWSLRGAS